MYDPPHLHWANDVLWNAIREETVTLLHEHPDVKVAKLAIHVPKTLLHYNDEGAGQVLLSEPRQFWGSDRVFFTQTCGYPWRTDVYLTKRLKYVASPMFDEPHSEEAFSTSVFIVRRDPPSKYSHVTTITELQGAVFAANERTSNTGYNLPRIAMARALNRGNTQPPFSKVLYTGSHTSSIAAVLSGEADTAAIDSVTFALWSDANPEAAKQLRSIATTAPTPTLPFVVSSSLPDALVEVLRTALNKVLTQPTAEVQRAMKALRLLGTTVLPPTAYDIVVEYQKEAAEKGVTELTQ